MTIEAALTVIEPRPAMRTIDWALEYGFTETGQPYSDLAYPHLSAPGGPFDAADCDQYFDIWLQWASRLGKTFGGQIVMMKKADHEPCPMMFSSADEKLALEVVERTYGMLENCLPLRNRLPPPNRRKQSRIHLKVCRVYVAWARSVSTLADKSVRFGHANEIDKWEHQSTSKEADPLKLFDDRSKEFPTFKRWKEGTPTVKGKSRIESGRLASCNASLFVPCPECGRYQTLRMGDGTDGGGIIWEHKDGRSDKDLAHKTARYVCLHCKAEIRDDHRGSMMRAGVWIPEGCECNDDIARETVEKWREPGREPWNGWKDSPWIIGTPVRDGPDYGSQLSSIYALARSWGDIAREFVDCKKKPSDLRNFINQWLAETWEHVKRKMTWEKLGERIIDKEIKRGVVPEWASMVTVGVDRQLTDNLHPWVVDAWGPDRSATIAYGECSSLEEIERDVATVAWPHADDGLPVLPSMVLIDSGNRPLGVHDLCDRLQAAGILSLPCKGSSTALNSDYDITTLGKNSSRPGAAHCLVDTIRSQLWIDRALHESDPKSAAGFALFHDQVFAHQDFLQQLLNDAPVEKTDSHNNDRESWDRIDRNIPNDYRDCKRYSYVAMLLATEHGRIVPRKFTPPREQPRQESRIRELRIRR